MKRNAQKVAFSIFFIYHQNLAENEKDQGNESKSLLLQTIENKTKEKDPLSQTNAREQINVSLNRDIREISSNSKSFPFEEQFEKLCRDPGSQPCTCYYPDHPNVTQFEFGSDDITKKCIKGQWTIGPNNCEDLKSFGHVLNGFYMVRFNPKRVKIINCQFNQTTKKTRDNNFTRPITLKLDNIKSSSNLIRFCGGVGIQPCTFFYSDHPDSPQTEPSSRTKNASTGDNGSRPTSCEDLKSIGYKLKGFYLVRFNGVKVKIVYCDFSAMTNENYNKHRNTRAVFNKKTTIKRKVSRFCDGVGSQPRSCYFSNQPNVLQLELSSDPVTRNASRENGAGPRNCEDLQNIGYTIKGFYIVRSRTLRMKMIFCEFLKVEEEKSQTAKGYQIEKKKSIGRSNNNDDTTITQHSKFLGEKGNESHLFRL